MRISVIIPAYNAEPYIRKAIESALAQTVPVHEIVVGNDGSSDRTGDVARELGARVLDLPRGNGSISRNRAVDAATGELLFFLDADDWWTPEKVATHLAAWEQYPDASVIFDPSRRISTTGVEGILNARGGPGPVDWRMFLDRRTWAGGSSFSVRREKYLGIGGFNEKLKGLQDVDFLVRIAAQYGHGQRIHPSCTYYLVTPNSVSRTPEAVMDNLQNAMAGWHFADEPTKRRFVGHYFMNLVEVTRFPESMRYWLKARARWDDLRFWRSPLRSIALTLKGKGARIGG